MYYCPNHIYTLLDDDWNYMNPRTYKYDELVIALFVTVLVTSNLFKRLEEEDYYDDNTAFSPFQLGF